MLEDFQKKIIACYILRYNLIVLSPSIGGTDRGFYLGWRMNRLTLNVATCALGPYICVKCVSLSFQNLSFRPCFENLSGGTEFRKMSVQEQHKHEPYED